MKLEGKVTGRRLKQVNPEILTSILLVSATILALIMSKAESSSKLLRISLCI